MCNYKKFIAGLTAVIMSAGTFAVCGVSSASAAVNPKSDTVKIMSIGDSITHGYINGDNGYRKYFNYYLQQNGITNFDMVGPNNSWSNGATYNWNGTTINYDPQHAGYSGYAIQSTGGRTGIQETIFNNTYSNNGVSGNMLEAYDPNIIMLQIGTNDLLDCQLDGIEDRLEELVDLILPYVSDEGEMLYLASVPDIDVEVRNDWLGAYMWKLGCSYSENPEEFTANVQNAVDNYNIAVRNLVAEKQSEGYNIGFTDINSVVDMKSGLDDGCHPNESGYACMGKLWAETLTETYFGNEFVEVTPIVTTTTTKASTTTTTKATTTTTTTTAKPVTTTVTTTAKPVTKPITGGSVTLNDVKIGEPYDISAYADVNAVSFVFNCTPQYGMNGCVAFGNWELSKNYDASMLANNTLTVDLDKDYNSLTIHKWYGDAELESVILHTADTSETTVKSTTTTTTTTTAKPTTTTTTTTTAKPTTTTTTTTTAKPTTTTTTTTTAKPTTTTTTTTAKPTTTTTTTTTAKPVTTTTASSSDSKTVVLTDVSVGEEYSLKKYDYNNIKKIVVKFDENVGYGFNGSLVLGNWSSSTSYTNADMKSDNTIEFDVNGSYDKMTIFRYWGSVGIDSVTLVY